MVSPANAGGHLGDAKQGSGALELGTTSEQVSAYSADVGIPPDVAYERLELQVEVEELIAQAEEIAGDRLGDSRIGHEPEFGAYISVTAGPRIAELDALTHESFIVSVTYDAPFSREEMLEAIDDNHALLTSEIDGAVGVYPDTRSGEIVVSSFASDLQARSSRMRIDDIPIRVEQTTEGSGDQYRGGVRLSPACTSGFGVRNSAGTRGFLTAGHCGNDRRYALTPQGSTTYASTYRGQVRNHRADAQWHSPASHTQTNVFYGASATNPITRSGTGTGAIGSSLCHRGAATNHSCGTVITTQYRPVWSDACPGTVCSSTWVLVGGSNLRSNTGDSGGPWYNGARAYGIHKGSDGSRGVYMPIAYIADLGVGLL